MSAIEAHNLRKTFGQVVAVNDVSIDVKEGEIFGFLGQNGAGKTTTIRMLTGVLVPDTGSIRICGIDVRKQPLEAKLNMGVIPENGTVYSDLTAEQNILWTAKCYGMDKASRTERTGEILKKLGLYQRKDDVVKYFSKGMRQRISIACAIVHSPPVLFLDEPTSGLDVYSRRLVIDTVRDMNDEGSTILITTHNIEEASELCSNINVINKGQIIASGNPEKLRSRFDTQKYIEVAFDQLLTATEFAAWGFERTEHHGDKWRLYMDDTDRAVKNLAALAEEDHKTIVSIATSSPSLEEAFIRLTGGI